MAESAAPSEQSQASRDEFKRWVRDWRSLDTEIKSASKALNELKKQRKGLYEHILEWMQGNNVARVRVREDQFLERYIDARPVPVNAAYIEEKLATHLFQGHPEQAKEVVGMLYDNRAIAEKEVLKLTQPRKRRRARPVDGGVA